MMKKSDIVASGLALFSMFFGAGTMTYPLILGGATGTAVGYALVGLLLTGVLLPLLGLLAIMLYEGDYVSFFSRIGKWPGLVLLFVVQAILGPVGSIPRLITLSHATLHNYFPNVSLLLFSILACFLLAAMMIRESKLISVLGYALTPLLLLAVGSIIVIGAINHPAPMETAQSGMSAFSQGFHVGYNTLDFIASFLFGTLIYRHFRGDDPEASQKSLVMRFLQASGIAVLLLMLAYGGLCVISSFYTPHLGPLSGPEKLLPTIAVTVLGPYGGVVASIAVALACLTTAVSILDICADYLHRDLSNKKIGFIPSVVVILVISGLLANLGFVGIAHMLDPLLKLCVPGLLVLSLFNIGHKVYHLKPVKLPVAAAFTCSILWGVMTFIR